jgi:hypothetical protein
VDETTTQARGIRFNEVEEKGITGLIKSLVQLVLGHWVEEEVVLAFSNVFDKLIILPLLLGVFSMLFLAEDEIG